MGKFKVGDFVITNNGDTAKVVGTSDNGWYYLENKIGHYTEDFLTLMEKTMDNLQVGDVVKQTTRLRGYSFTVTGKLGEVYVGYDEDKCAEMHTAKELIEDGYKLQSEEPKELTVEEISKELGYDVKVVKG